MRGRSLPAIRRSTSSIPITVAAQARVTRAMRARMENVSHFAPMASASRPTVKIAKLALKIVPSVVEMVFASLAWTKPVETVLKIAARLQLVGLAAATASAILSLAKTVSSAL